MQNFLNDDLNTRRRSAGVNRRLQDAVARRDRYLSRHPHLRPYQAEIDRVLDKSGSVHGRMAVLGTLIHGKLIEMQKELRKLNQFLQ
ncbi:hypothetical protein DSCA_20350 [Desulfosarcina alkanivorans]|jgi:hypothetical protein|uniref:Uncharacterized protein n=1 Tax=Desulfosarcina alkanivorans TaxID=571177 RepID=A0A5K7YI98_9BACT|nr:hypothetical protein [Desulfosarcina alkanivorans]BBO68105.1 hypothetical protein DSCA_20350 [Desulfosarcina alkanivorans]